MPLSTIQALWTGVIIGLLSRTYTHLLGTLAMTNWLWMLKKGLSTILHNTSYFTEKFECSPASTRTKFDVFLFFFARGFCHFRLCLWVWQPHIWHQPCMGIEFAHSVFRLYNPAVLSFGEALEGGSINHGHVYEEWRSHK